MKNEIQYKEGKYTNIATQFLIVATKGNVNKLFKNEYIKTS